MKHLSDLAFYVVFVVVLVIVILIAILPAKYIQYTELQVCCGMAIIISILMILSDLIRRK